MKILIDACVLYPTVMREIMLGVAKAGLFTPLWSARILEEWARAAAKLGPEQGVFARGEIALLRASWPDSEVAGDSELEQSLYLPDLADRHVLASAINGGAKILITMNLRDFPRRTLSEFQISPIHPDAFLRGLFDDHPDQLARVTQQVRQQAEQLSGQAQPLRALLKKARLPRLGKALDTPI